MGVSRHFQPTSRRFLKQPPNQVVWRRSTLIQVGTLAPIQCLLASFSSATVFFFHQISELFNSLMHRVSKCSLATTAAVFGLWHCPRLELLPRSVLLSAHTFKWFYNVAHIYYFLCSCLYKTRSRIWFTCICPFVADTNIGLTQRPAEQKCI